MNTTYKILFFFLAFLPVTLWAQTETDLKLLTACKKEVKDIDNQVLYKKQLIWVGEPEDSVDYKVVDYGKAADGNLIYYDMEHRIRKFINMFNYPEYTGFSIHYFDKNGNVVYSVFFHQSAMDYTATGSRYMNKNKLVYLDIEIKGEDNAIVKTVEQYGGKMPDIDDQNFNFFLHTDSIKVIRNQEEWEFNADDCKKVKFDLPRKNDTTVTNVRRANLRKSPSTDSEKLATIQLGDIVQMIQPSEANWYKVKVNGKTGYIYGELLEPVEYMIK